MGILIAVIGIMLAVSPAQAQQHYPTKPVRLIVPFAPGGGTDITARMLAQKLGESFKQTVIVDNRPGGGGIIAMETAVKAQPDGYTLILLTTGYTTNAALNRLTYDPVNDVTPIGLIGETGFLVTLHPSLPTRGLKELIAYEKASPGTINYGSAGTGGITHIATELLNHMAGTGMTHVPYKGAGPALNDLLSGQIQLLLAAIPAVVPHVKTNRLRAIATTSAKRSSAAPGIPTVGETVRGYEAPFWFGVLGPKGLPKAIVARWNGEIERIVQLPEVKERMANDGTEPIGGSPEHFREVLKRDVTKWQKVVKIAGIKPGD